MSGPDLRRVLGMMSGTSLDGVDCVLTEFRSDAPRLVRHWAVPFPGALRRRLLACASGAASSWETARLHHDLGRFFAGAARRDPGGGRIDAVGLHGQTIFHAPGGAAPATLQLGEPAYLAAALGVPVVSNFRAADLAAGGQGAPLATRFHVAVFAQPGRHVCVQNLGGIANVTSIDGRGRGAPRILAFDTGPGNMLLDGAVARLSGGRRRFDREGRGAARGRPAASLVAGVLRDPFVRRAPPKSTGREAFGAPYLDRLWARMEALGLGPADRLATLAEATARTIALNYREHLPAPPDRVVLCGGGARNTDLVRRLHHALRPRDGEVELVSCAALGWPVETVEGAAFALLARERLLGRPGNVPSTTGARRAVLCGQVTAP